ncbi:hypothetical protein [Nocardia arthritidis]|uniref:Uncharacterized protein n=1 Tax=Nocardia arthritidis TaxID=228602 RepID=A0A6G9YBS3_9NOCA|nr:hypothetical protein [Nocardia arthritidis]QIS10725.1 hypothetical protein F5544_14190 [Nocardia arthritidis]
MSSDRAIPQWLKSTSRVTIAVAVLLAVPGIALAFGLSAYSASTAHRAQAPAGSALAAARAGVNACPETALWTSAPNGRGIRVNMRNIATPGRVTVTVLHDSDRVSVRTKDIAAGQNSIEVDFHKIYPDTVDAVFMQTTPNDKCELDSLDDARAPGPSTTPEPTPPGR